jgi:hypothetical protein
MARRPILIAFGLFMVMAVVAVLAILTGEPAAKDTDEPELRPLALPAEPTWSDASPWDGSGSEVRDGSAVLHGGGGLRVLDTDTGRTRWSVEHGAELPGGGGSRWASTFGWPRLVTHEEQLAVLTEDLRCPGCKPEDLAVTPAGEHGLTLLSAEDGSVLWRTVTIPSGSPGVIHALIADDRIALVALAQGSVADGWETIRTVAYDLRDGSELWVVDGSWPLAIADDVVLLHTGAVPPSVDPGVGVLQEATVTAVATATGEQRWDLADLFDRTELLLVAGDVALVRAADEGKKHPRGLLVTIEDGQRLHELGYGSFDGCGTDGRTLIACPSDGDLLTFQVADGRSGTVATEVEVGRVDAVWQDRIFVSHGPARHSVSRAGTLLDKNLPGDLVARADDVLLFRNRDDDRGMASLDGYRLRS